MKTPKELIAVLRGQALSPEQLKELLSQSLAELQLPVSSEQAQSVIETLDFHEAETLYASSPHPPAKKRADKVPSWPELDQQRYTRGELIGRGAMGEVWRLRDQLLNRDVALKLIHEDHHLNHRYITRFTEEAKICALLTHPSIISIYDVIRWQDGRLGFLMEEVRGIELSKLIKLVHDQSPVDHWTEVNGWNLKRLIDALLRVSEAIAYAHDHGVIHRDLKPNNIMVGEHGQVWVLDWGLARPWSPDDLSVTTPDHLNSFDGLDFTQQSSQTSLHAEQSTTSHWYREALTRMGEITGTPYYMPPEQAAGHLNKMGPWSDVYALGAILYEILRGRPPYAEHSATEAIKLSLLASPPSLREEALMLTHQRPIPNELIEICEAALCHDYKGRLQRVRSLSTQLRTWLDGSQRRTQALKEVEVAQRYRIHAEERRTEAIRLRAEAERLLATVPKWENASHKWAGWNIEDEAKRLEAEAERLTADELRTLQSAINLEPSLREARIILAQLALERHRDAEYEKRFETAAIHAVTLSDHISMLPPYDPIRLRCERYLNGQSAVQLTFEVDAEIELFRFERVNRVLTPLHLNTYQGNQIDVDLPIGSYLLKLSAKNRYVTSYPFALERSSNWVPIPPGKEVPHPVSLPLLDSLLPWERYVPAGWFYCGGDPETPNSPPERRVWVNSFSISEAPVTHREYLLFLNTLSAEGRLDEALRWAPREQANEDGAGALRYQLTEEGQVTYFSHPLGDTQLNYPVVSVSWYSACAYAEWLSTQTHKEWRLPLELEFEKSARGVDRRFFPWGNDFDPSFCIMMDSHPEELEFHPVKAKTHDRSVYGVWDCAGNIREWCLDTYYAEGAPLEGGRARFPTGEELSSTQFKSSRGGSAGNSAIRTRSADRDWWAPHQTYLGRGFRVARSITD